MENPPLQLPQVSRNVCWCSIVGASEKKSQVTNESELTREFILLHSPPCWADVWLSSEAFLLEHGAQIRRKSTTSRPWGVLVGVELEA